MCARGAEIAARAASNNTPAPTRETIVSLVRIRNVFTSLTGKLSCRAHKARTISRDPADGLFAESGAVSGQVAAGAGIDKTRLAAWRRAYLRIAVLRVRYAVVKLRGSGKMSPLE